jgi:hypothetical protein
VFIRGACFTTGSERSHRCISWTYKLQRSTQRGWDVFRHHLAFRFYGYSIIIFRLTGERRCCSYYNTLPLVLKARGKEDPTYFLFCLARLLGEVVLEETCIGYVLSNRVVGLDAKIANIMNRFSAKYPFFWAAHHSGSPTPTQRPSHPSTINNSHQISAFNMYKMACATFLTVTHVHDLLYIPRLYDRHEPQ